MTIDAAGERSEQGRFRSKSPGSSNAVLGGRVRSIRNRISKEARNGFKVAAG